MSVTHPGSLRPKTRPPTAARRRSRRPAMLQRIALSLSAALADWAQEPLPDQPLTASPLEESSSPDTRLRDADRRRDAAMTDRLLMPRQY